ncbi:hypothetical protein [Streptomyces sasae]|uniref:hypothetical protein n=1 Tax=Streptomyces sasae TaxID=1266772 RepID=UPI00292F8C31|nr:hypothetical protein [Streptomyces sasae]
MIDKLTAHWGFTRMPFGKDLAPSMLHRHSAHAQAVARITWCIGERALGVITGEVGAGKNQLTWPSKPDRRRPLGLVASRCDG